MRKKEHAFGYGEIVTNFFFHQPIEGSKSKNYSQLAENTDSDPFLRPTNRERALTRTPAKSGLKVVPESNLQFNTRIDELYHVDCCIFSVCSSHQIPCARIRRQRRLQKLRKEDSYSSCVSCPTSLFFLSPPRGRKKISSTVKGLTERPKCCRKIWLLFHLIAFLSLVCSLAFLPIAAIEPLTSEQISVKENQRSSTIATCLYDDDDDDDQVKARLCKEKSGNVADTDTIVHRRTTRLSRPSEENDIVRTITLSTKHGAFRGIIMFDNKLSWQKQIGQIDRDKVVGFLGVRYASAPVKRLRFMPPTPYRHLANQLYDATKFGPICIQRWPIDLDRLAAYNEMQQNNKFAPDIETSRGVNFSSMDSLRTNSSSSATTTARQNSLTMSEIKLELLSKAMPSVSFNYLRPLFKRLIAKEQSEDCLNLNIYVPLQVALQLEQQQQQQEALALTKLPVLVIIHGESFDYGAGSAYDGQKLLFDHQSRTQMLVVTFNYRLNIFGFLPKLSGASRGNLGLMDQIAALHWIKENIGSFGGSPSNITLMGTKKGALFVNLLMLSPMAKGLFHRAIMEDGSALSPITANQVAQHHQQHQQQQQYTPSNSAHYLRILAKLCDCPSAGPNTSNLQSTRISLDSGKHLNSLPTEDKTTNVQLLECLRYKPVDQVAQQIPMDFIQLDPNSGEIMVQLKWQYKLRSLLSASTTTVSDMTAGIPIKSSEHLGQILGQIITGHERLEKNYPLFSESSSINSELFEAIYSQHSSLSNAHIVRPLFGPLIDGSIVPDEDFATSLLKEESNLVQRDLLIGFSHPVLYGINQDDQLTTGTGAGAGAAHNRDRMQLLSPDNFLSERILAAQERQGLSNEQAIGLVNAFVRSFHRYHNQEIANSILNHYLSLAASNQWHQQVSSGPVSTNKQQQQQEKNSDYHRTTNNTDNDELTKLQHRRREFLLNSISRLFQDSLTDVPLFKFALIHSIKQMDPLVNVFLDILFEQWETTQTGKQHLDDSEQDNLSHSPVGSASDRKSLLESFNAFARQHLDDTAQLENGESPLRHLAANTHTKSTYLYQSDSGIGFSQYTAEAIERILTREKAIDQENIWKLISPTLRNLATKVKSSSPPRATLDCAYYPPNYSNHNEDDADDGGLAARLEEWFCSKQINGILKRFVVTGDVNQDDNHITMGRPSARSLDEYLDNIESKCYLPTTISDHHSVQPDMNDMARSSSSNDSTSSNQYSVQCKEQLSNIAITVLTNELAEYNGRRSSNQSRWTNFNVFSQKIATLNYEDPTRLWRMNRISEFSNEPTGLVSKSSFWSNFIPALNCNKTQPITPSALLDGSLNSSLLTLNLQFTCQHGSKTAQDYIESIVSIAGHRLQMRKNQWFKSKIQSASGLENHHSLRMANMSQSNSVDEVNLDTNDEHNVTNSTNLSSLVNKNIDLNIYPNGKTQTTDIKANKVTGFVLVLCALIVSVTLISGSYLAFKRHRRRQNNTNRREKNKQTSNGDQQQDLSIKPNDQAANEASDVVAHDMNYLPINHLVGIPEPNTEPVTTTEIIGCLETQIDGENLHATEQWEPINWSGRNCINATQSSSSFKDEHSDASQQFHYNTSVMNQPSRMNGQYRSNSAMSLASQMQAANNFVSVERDFDIGLHEQQFGTYDLEFGLQEPIVLPILSNNHHYKQQQGFRCQTLDSRRHNYLANMDNQSSTETQNGHSSRSSTVASTGTMATSTKKRVKINEPQSIMKPNQNTRRYTTDDTGSQHKATEYKTQQQQQQQQYNQSRIQLCPIHSGSQSNQYRSASNTGFILDNGHTEYLTISDPERWISEQRQI